MGEVEQQVQFEKELKDVSWLKKRKRLCKQLSMWEAPREIAWERKRRQERRTSCDDVTDEDLDELKGCIELGFGFKEEEGQKLCNTLPALDLYFAVNRVSSPRPSSSFPSPITTSHSDSWKICSPGDDPEHVKTKLRHWAQVVACSVMQSH